MLSLPMISFIYVKFTLKYLVQCNLLSKIGYRWSVSSDCLNVTYTNPCVIDLTWLGILFCNAIMSLARCFSTAESIIGCFCFVILVYEFII